MEFKVTKSSDYRYSESINIESLHELLSFVITSKREVIISRDEETNCWELEIYDSYRE